MTDLGLTNALNANTHVESEHADAAAAGSSDGALHASENGATYDGSSAADASYSTDAASGSAGADAGATGSASGSGLDVEPSLDGVPELGLPVDAPELPATPELPELPTDVPELPVDTSAVDGVSGSVGLEAMIEGMVDVMGALAAQFAGSLTAILGF